MTSNPAPRHPPAVYWRRRAVALLALLVAVALIVFGIKALFGGGDGSPSASSSPSAASPSSSGSASASPSASTSPSGDASASPSTSTSPSASASPSASPSDSATAAGPAACTAEQIAVVATMDKNAYKATDTANVGMTITNKSKDACTMDVGSGPLSLTITSGSDRIWSSDDCGPQGVTSRMALVQPGESGRLASQVRWNLDRSRPGCPGGTPTAAATRVPELKAGNYRLVAKAGDITSSPKVFQIQ